MLSSFIRSPALLISLPLLALIASSHQANAEIYKWRDDRGVTQYSDRPPVSSFTKVTRNEMVNALQTKDLCTVGPIQKSVASTKNINTFFGFTVNKQNAANTSSLFRAPVARSASITGSTGKSSNARFINTRFTNAVSDTAAPSTSIASRSTSTIAAVNSARVSAPVVKTARPATQVSPLGIASILNNGNDKITVFGIPRTNIVASTNLLTPKAIQPTPVVIATATATAPVSVATAPAQVNKAPIQLAVNTPAESNTSNPSPNLIQVGLMPAVDISKNITPAIGFSALRIKPTSESPTNSGGEFRVVCTPSHMSNDDPIVYPNQQGAAHHHTFFGNVTIDYKSNLMTLPTTGNSTCNGGTMNRSAYWAPSMIDTSTNTPIAPSFAIFYYKNGGVDGTLIKAPPKGLRMITGNSKGNNIASAKSMFTCLPPDGVTRPFYGWSKNIPACAVGDSMQMLIGFSQCWDGKNLDSPNHQDHMSGPNKGQCPTTHPVAIPQVTLGLSFKIDTDHQTNKWRLASDNYTFDGKNAGYSAHADWVNGWDETTMAGIVKNCINAKKDAHAHLLCDGRTFY